MLRFCSLLFLAAASLAAAPCKLIVSARYVVTMLSQIKAVSEGARRFTRAAVADTDVLTPSCGDVEIVLSNLAGKQESMRLGTLFPRAFDASFL